MKSKGLSQSKTKKRTNKKIVRDQPRKDNSSRRVNFDNERESKFDKEFERKDSNDISWYTKNPGLTIGAARIPFAAIPGTRIVPNFNVTVPGVMALQYSPNFMVDDGYVLNQAAFSYYSDVVHANSRNQSYDAADLMIMTLAGAQVIAAIGTAIRLYGIMNNGYLAENAYVPEGLIEAQDFGFKDLQENYSHMMFDINRIILQSRQIWLPKTLPIVERWFWMNTSIYMDGESNKSQYYMYSQKDYYMYSPKTSSKGSELVRVTGLDGSKTWKTFISKIESMIQVLLENQDRGIMYGDILKAYGASNIFMLNEVALDYKTVPTYNKEVLWQMENAMGAAYVRPHKLSQDEYGNLVQTWMTNTDTPTALNEELSFRPSKFGLLNFHQAEEPTPEQILVATRMMAIGHKEVNVGSTTVKMMVPTAAGTEILQRLYILYREWDTTNNKYKWNNAQYTTIMKDLSTTSIAQIEALKVMAKSACDWSPHTLVATLSNVHNEGSFKDYDLDAIIADFENYTVINPSDLMRLHQAAAFSLFNVPTL